MNTQVPLDTLNPVNSPVLFIQQTVTCFSGSTDTGTGTVRHVFDHLANLHNLGLASTDTFYSTSLPAAYAVLDEVLSLKG